MVDSTLELGVIYTRSFDYADTPILSNVTPKHLRHVTDMMTSTPMEFTHIVVQG